MAEPLTFDPDRPEAGRLESVSPLVRRYVHDNPGPFTCTGTCCYVIGHGRVIVLDPGPGSAGEAEALLSALDPADEVRAILVTHTHRDHSPGARRLKAITGAPILGCAPHHAARDLGLGERNVLDASADREHAPDTILKEGDGVEGDGFRLTAVATPGHTMNHLAFDLDAENALFSGDHVMAWSTSIVAPPDGAMGAYMASLEKLRGRDHAVYWPGHGGPVREPERFLRAIIGHRRMRESSILSALGEGPQTIPSLVNRLYVGLNPALRGAAGLSVFAHLEDLAYRGLVMPRGEPSLDVVWAQTL